MQPLIFSRSAAMPTKKHISFLVLSPNSIDAVSDRDFIAEVLFAATMIGTHLSRLAEDLIVYGSSEFGFVQFGEGYTSGSSIRALAEAGVPTPAPGRHQLRRGGRGSHQRRRGRRADCRPQLAPLMAIRECYSRPRITPPR